MKRYKRADKLIEDDLKAITDSDMSFRTKFIADHYPLKNRSSRLVSLRYAIASLVVVFLAFTIILTNLFSILPSSGKNYDGENQLMLKSDIFALNNSTQFISFNDNDYYEVKIDLTIDTYYRENLFFTVFFNDLIGLRNLVFTVIINQDYKLENNYFPSIEKRQLLGFECLYSERITISNERQEILYEVKAEIITPFEIIQINYNEKAEVGCPNSFQTVIETLLYV